MAGSVMRKVSVRSLSSHKLRLVLTVFSVVLGTSFVAAALIFTSTVSSAFNSIFDNFAKGVAVQVTAKSMDAPGVPVSVVDQLRAEKAQLGIDKLVVNNSGPVTVADSAGKPIQTGGAPSIGEAYLPPEEAIGDAAVDIVAGRAPQGMSEILINQDAADKAGLGIGSKTKVVIGTGSAAPLDVTVVGITDLPTSTGGYVGIQFDAQTADQLFSDGEYVRVVDMTAVAGKSDTELRDAVHSRLGPAETVDAQYEVRTGDQVRADQKAEVKQFLDLLQYVFLAFAAIGLLVGTFIIYNTFSMIVAQRNRELALLRAVGASREDVSRSVLTEALIVGVVGGLLGLALGVGVAAVLLAFVQGQGVPSNGVKVGVTAVLAALFVGVVVTMLSAWIPARRASRIPPVEAMRQSTVEPGAGSLRKRTLAAGVIGVLAVLALVIGGMGQGGGPAALVGLGALLLVIAVVLGAPAVAQPFIGALGRVLEKPFGTVGRLARTNAVRNPRRSAATAFALTLGLMLVVVIGALGATFKGTIDSTVDKGVRADYLVTASNLGTVPLSVGDAVREVPEVGTAVTQGFATAKVGDQQQFFIAPIGGDMEQVASIPLVTGSLTIPADGMAVDQPTADRFGWKMGDQVTLTAPNGDEVQVRVTGVFARNELVTAPLISEAVYDKLVPVAEMRAAGAIWVKGAPGADLGALRTTLEDKTAQFMIVQVLDRDQFKNTISTQVDQMMATLYALLGLALVIAVLGIINTLALSVVERKREIGMLRAVGMSRGQVRRSIYLESTYIAVFGALLGALLGLAISVPLINTLAEWGLGSVVIPWSLVIGTLIAAAIVGVIAALWPAITAARTRPLEAIVDA